jgi:cyclopropane fatty-acyl-phospholipid synthase-like methyltransferase
MNTMNSLETKLEKTKLLYTLLPPYDSMYEKPQYIAEDKITYGFIRKHLKFGDRLLDIGCGSGSLLYQLPIDPDCYLGVDLSAEMIRQAKELWPKHTFVECPGQEADGQFDVIVCLYGGYISVHEFKQICERSLKAGGHAFLHLVGASRNMTTIAKLEIDLGIQIQIADDTKIQLAQADTIIKMNAFNRWKKHLPTSLYLLTLRLEKYLPIPTRYFTWILLHFKKPL